MDKSQLAYWIQTTVRERLTEECEKEKHLALFKVGRDRGDSVPRMLAIFCLSVLEDLAGYDGFKPLPERIDEMNKTQLEDHMNRQLQLIEGAQTPDTSGSALIVFLEDGRVQFGATTLDPKTIGPALRELADRLERGEAVQS